MEKALPISALFETLAESLTASEIIASVSKANIANQIVEARLSRGETQAEFAQLFRIKQSTISKWENGDYNFTIDKLAEIAAKLDWGLTVAFSTKQPPEDRPSLNDNVIMINQYQIASVSTSLSAGQQTSLYADQPAELMEG